MNKKETYFGIDEALNKQEIPKPLVMRSYWHFLFDSLEVIYNYEKLISDQSLFVLFLDFCVINKVDFDWKIQIIFHEWLLEKGFAKKIDVYHFEFYNASTIQWTLFDQSHHSSILLCPKNYGKKAFLGKKGNSLKSDRKIFTVEIPDRFTGYSYYKVGDDNNNFNDEVCLINEKF